MRKKLLLLSAFLLGTLTIHAQQDVTSTYFSNTGFEEDGAVGTDGTITGWTVAQSTGGFSSKRVQSDATTSNGSYTVGDGVNTGASEGTYYLQIRTNWGSSSTVEMTQTSSELPVGHYQLKVDVLQPYSTTAMPVFTISVSGAGEGSATVQYEAPIWRTSVVDFDVETAGTVTLSLKQETGEGSSAGNMTCVDNIRLIQYNASTLQSLITEAEGLYDANKSGAESLSTAISTAKSASGSYADIQALESAISTYKEAQFIVPEDADCSDFITNASLETTSGGEVYMSIGSVWNSSTPSGWKVARMTAGNMNATTNTAQAKSGNAFEVWSWSSTTAGMLFQSIDKLPAGKYTLTAYLNGDETNKVFAKVGDNEFITNGGAAGDYSVTFVKETTDETLVIGAENQGAWLVVDEFSLTCEGLDLGSETLTVTDAGMATYSSDYALDFSEVTGLKAYTATYDADANLVTFHVVEGAVPAKTGLLLKAEGGATVEVPECASANAVENILVGNGSESVTVAASTSEAANFTLRKQSSGVNFVLVTADRTLAANKAYAHIEADFVSSEAKALSIAFDDESATAITTIATGSEAAKKGTYNMAGQRVGDNYKGLVIVNGKKVLRK